MKKWVLSLIIILIISIGYVLFELFNYKKIDTLENIYEEEQNQPLRILDVILFNNEIDYLEIRLNELYDTVDIFYIIESNKTFSGNSKSLIFKENINKFNNFIDKIVYVELPLIQNKNFWSVEYFVRNEGLKLAFEKYNPQMGDLIMMSDLDEIPKPSALKQIKYCKDCAKVLKLECKFYYYSYQFHHHGDDWIGAVIHKFETIEKFPSGQQLREMRDDDNIHQIPNSCWHCTWCFSNINAFINKASSYSHKEHNDEEFMNKEWIIDHVRYGIDLFERPGEYYEYIEDNQDIPNYINKNRKKFAYMLDRRNDYAGFIENI